MTSREDFSSLLSTGPSQHFISVCQDLNNNLWVRRIQPVHFLWLPPLHSGSWALPEPIPAAFRRRRSYTLDQSPVHGVTAQRQIASRIHSATQCAFATWPWPCLRRFLIDPQFVQKEKLACKKLKLIAKSAAVSHHLLMLVKHAEQPVKRAFLKIVTQNVFSPIPVCIQVHLHLRQQNMGLDEIMSCDGPQWRRWFWWDVKRCLQRLWL